MPVGFKSASSRTERSEPDSDLEFLEQVLSASDQPAVAPEHPAHDDEGEVSPERASLEDRQPTVKDKMKDLASFLLPPSTPANDDKESIGALIRAIESRGSRMPNIAAIAATSVCVVLGVLFLRGESARLFGGDLLRSEAVIILLAIAGFVSTFFLLTGVAVRSRETQATVRILTKLVASNLDGGTSRRAAEDDGEALNRLSRIETAIETSYARAEKLGSAYQADCAKFEKSVAQSEARLKKIVEEFSVERASIVTSAEKLRFSISGSHHNFSNDLEAATAKLEKLIDTAGTRVVGEIETKSEEVSRFARQAEEKTSSHLRSLFENTLLRATERLEEVNNRFAANLSAKGAELEGRLSGRLREATLVIERQAEDVQQKSCARVDDVTAQVSRLLDRMNIALADRSDTLKAVLAEKLVEIAQTFREGSIELSKELERVASIADRLSGVTLLMNENTSEQITKLNDEIVTPLRSISATLGAESFQFVQRYLSELETFDQKLLDNSKRASVVIEGSIDGFQTNMDKVVDRFARISDRTTAELTAFADRRLAALDATPLEPAVASAPAVALAPVPAERAPRALPTQTPVEARASRASAAITGERTAASRGEVDAKAAQAAASAPDRGANETAGPGKSWISELLARASVDERSAAADTDAVSEATEIAQPLSPESDMQPAVVSGAAPSVRHSVSPQTDGRATLQSLFGAADRLFLDDQHLQDAWDDFRSGKPDAFANVYTDEGSVLKQRLREKLGTDGDLRKSIDTYSRDFESLLVKAYNGADDETFLGFITTDAGKIYTVLADVSGRLDLTSSSLRPTASLKR